jgi:hypothetical protein
VPASTVAELLAGDITIEEAWAAILNRALAGSGATAAIAFSDSTKSTPYVEIEFEETQVTDHVHIYNGFQYRDVTRGTLVARICTTRGVDSDQQKTILGQVRAAAQDWRAQFNTDALPYWGINLFNEVGLKRYVDPENRVDKTELRYHVHFNIRPAAWPA